MNTTLVNAKIQFIWLSIHRWKMPRWPCKLTSGYCQNQQLLHTFAFFSHFIIVRFNNWLHVSILLHCVVCLQQNSMLLCSHPIGSPSVPCPPLIQKWKTATFKLRGEVTRVRSNWQKNFEVSRSRSLGWKCENSFWLHENVSVHIKTKPGR